MDWSPRVAGCTTAELGFSPTVHLFDEKETEYLQFIVKGKFTFSFTAFNVILQKKSLIDLILF